MKKLIIVLIVLALAIPVFAFAAGSDSFFVGTWVNIMPHANTPGETITVLHLTEDYRAYFMIQSFNDSDGPEYGRSALKTWTSAGDWIRVKIGENATLDLKVNEDGTMHDVYRPQDIYIRVGSAGDQ